MILNKCPSCFYRSIIGITCEIEVSKMKQRFVGIILLGLLTISGILPMIAVNAVVWPNLPTSTVQLTVVYGTSSYFRSTLSGVPAGYDVKNGVYSGWCIERTTNMIRGVAHPVRLYSSLTPPAVVSSIDWTAINYIINHKQGGRMDVQGAIWHYTNGYTSLTTAAQAMINAADTNPTWNPATARILAIICLGEESTGVQDTIIEISRSLLPGLSPGYWKHNVKVYNGGPGAYSAPSTNMPHETDGSMEAYALTIMANHRSEIPAEVDTASEFLTWANTRFQSTTYKSSWLKIANWFNEAAGRLPYTSS